MAIDVYGATWCGDCKQAKNTLEELGAEYTWHNIETEDGGSRSCGGHQRPAAHSRGALS